MLNENQTLAVNHRDGPCLTLAGPGSGKTTVLVERILKLIKSGVDPAKILVITFTKDAAAEMKARFLAKSFDNSSDVTFGTFHSVFYHILRDDIRYRDYELIYGKKKLALIKECAALLDFDNISAEMITRLEKDLSYYANTGESPPENECLLTKEDFLMFLKLFEKRKQSHFCMDFDDMLIKTKMLLSEDEKSLRKWQNRYSYFLVDELQDINGVQFDVLKLLLSNHPCKGQNIFGVGDDDQSIYGFRGASPKFMMDFPKIFEGCKIIELSVNYRSASEIVYSSKELIGNNKDRFFKDYKAFSKDRGSVNIKKFENDIEEAKSIASILSSEDKMDILKDTAILYRNRSQAAAVYSFLKKEGLAVFSDEPMQELSDTFVARDILAYLRLATSPMRREDVLLILNKPNRELGRGGLLDKIVDPDKWLSFYPKGSAAKAKILKLLKQLELISGFSPFSAVNFIRRGIGYDEYLKNLAKTGKGSKEELLAWAESFLSYAQDFSSIKELLKNLQSERSEPKKAEKGDQKISLYTFHGSKGLEFERVFILDSNEGITPSKNAKTDEALEEERRMFYVAMTRAKKELNICVIENRGEHKLYPSRFISETGIRGALSEEELLE